MNQPPSTLSVVTGDGLELTAEVWKAEAVAAGPVVLLHGLSQQRRFWGPVINRLRSGPIACLDQRGHGDSNTPVDADYSVASCADDVIRLMDALGWERCAIAGHSWGGSVALRAGARHGDRISALALVDGGLWSPGALGDRATTRQRLTPPPLGLPADELWAMIRSGALGVNWSDELEQALSPTFREDSDGLLHSRLGLERHLLVLDGLLDVDPREDLLACAAAGMSVWAAVCEPVGTAAAAEGEWSDLKASASAAAAALPNVLIHRWAGAIHDVPLQWPDLVAGFIDSAVASAPVMGGRG